MIKIDNLSFTYPGAKNANLKNITLNIEKGDFVAIIGNNGCGKSTLCKTLNGLIPHYFTGDFEGNVIIDGMNTLEHKVGELALKVGYVYQDFENQIVRPTVLDDASFACLNFAIKDYQEKGRQALHMTGLMNKQNDYVWQLSGGQKHLLALAGMVALSPDILILDEPIAQLDPCHAVQIYDTLKTLNEEYGKTIIVIEHHTEFIAEYCKHVILMKEGSIDWMLPVSEALNRVDELTKNNIFPPQVTIAAKELESVGYERKNSLLPITIKEGKDYFSGLSTKKSYEIKEKKDKKSQPIIQFEKVGIEYRAVKGENYKILHNFSLTIKKGEKIALIGNNGAGKSTLLKLMTGLLKPRTGWVSIYNTKTNETTPEFLSKTISLVYQNPEEMFIKDSIGADIEYAMKVRKIEGYEKKTEDLLSMFRLNDMKEKDGRLLSGGQMRRASLAIGIALNPSILLLDEPTANLDIATRKEIMKTLTSMKDKVETVIIATHDMQLVTEWADRILVLKNGEIIGDGDREEVFYNKEIVHQAGIMPPEIFTLGRILDESARCFTVSEFVNYFGKGDLYE
jgi:energy-coupling factor transport system ATP-binding protein